MTDRSVHDDRNAHLGRSHHALGAFYRRIGARVGEAKAITATARKLSLLVHTSTGLVM
jgi:hypothetical protein